MTRNQVVTDGSPLSLVLPRHNMPFGVLLPVATASST
jgi:hypothetical protein